MSMTLIFFSLLALIKAASFTPDSFSLIDYEFTPIYLDHDNYGLVDLKKFEVYPGYFLNYLWERQYSIPILLKFLGPKATFHHTSFFSLPFLENVSIELLCRAHHEIIIPFETKLIEAQAPIEDLGSFMMQARQAFSEGRLMDFIQERSQTFGLLQVTYFLEAGMDCFNYADDLPLTNEEKHELYLMKLAIANLFSFSSNPHIRSPLLDHLLAFHFMPEVLSHALHTKERIEAYIAKNSLADIRWLWNECVNQSSNLTNMPSDIIAAFMLATGSEEYLDPYAPVDIFVTNPELRAILPQMLTRAPTQDELGTLMSVLQSTNPQEVGEYLEGPLFFGNPLLRVFLIRRRLSLGGSIVSGIGFDANYLSPRVLDQGMMAGLIACPLLTARYAGLIERAKTLAALLEKHRAKETKEMEMDQIKNTSLEELANFIRFYPDWDYFPDDLFRVKSIDYRTIYSLREESWWHMFQVALKFKFPYRFTFTIVAALAKGKSTRMHTVKPCCQELLAQEWTFAQYEEILDYMPHSPCAIHIFRAFKVPISPSFKLPYHVYLLGVNPVGDPYIPHDMKFLLGLTRGGADSVVETISETFPDPVFLETIFKESGLLQEMAPEIFCIIMEKTFKPSHNFLKMHLLFSILPSAMSEKPLAKYLPLLYRNMQYISEIEQRGAAHLRHVMENRVMKKPKHLAKMLELMAVFNLTGTLSHIQAATSAADAQSAALEYFTVSQGFNRKPLLDLFEVIHKKHILAVLKGLGPRLGIKLTSETTKTAIVCFFENDLPNYLSRDEMVEIVRELQWNCPEFRITLPTGGQKRERDEDDDERSSKKQRTENEDGMQVDTKDT